LAHMLYILLFCVVAGNFDVEGIAMIVAG